MINLSAVVLAAALSAAPGAINKPEVTTTPVELKFVSKSSSLLGMLYGLDAIDEKPRLFGQRESATFSAGLRTDWYSCPYQPDMQGGSRITFAFEAGHSYELVCQPGKDAVIRQTDEC